ncbi:hypothetical protein AMECASPLE_035296 [Ameca splendens]|uniref:Uncharacterized protein n=1 Tax=Ameca splendens TaxID=208324 RepID=A0ABV0YVB1_9TELE
MHSCFEFFFPGWSFPFNPQDSLFWGCLVIHINYVHAVPVINLTQQRQLTAQCAAQGALFFHLSTCPPKCLCTPLCMGVACSPWVPPTVQNLTVRLTGISQMPLGGTGCESCVSLCCPAMDWRPVHGNPTFHPLEIDTSSPATL